MRAASVNTNQGAHKSPTSSPKIFYISLDFLTLTLPCIFIIIKFSHYIRCSGSSFRDASGGVRSGDDNVSGVGQKENS